MSTEDRNPRSMHLDSLSALEVVRLMNEEERAVFDALDRAARGLAEAAQRAARAFKAGGRVIYIGAGTSGRVAMADAAEMPPTFGIERDRFVAVIPGGSEAMVRAVEVAEDDEGAAISSLKELSLTPTDVVIGLAASGRTPFVRAGVRYARDCGVWTCGIANSPGAPLLHEADLGVLLDTGPEVLTGSTRLKAGTAQKLALNRISTTAMVLCGKVIENLMVDVKATNQKLRERCVTIVCELTGVARDEARQRLERSGWSVRAALDLV